MQDSKMKLYWLSSLFCALIAGSYPLFIGAKVITDMLTDGTVMKENYPKYIIPYTPITFAVIAGILFMPLFLKCFKRFAVPGGSALSLSVFWITELLFENKVVVTTAQEVIKLENWQMYMCYAPPEGWGKPKIITEYKTHSAVEILMGEYNPAFKLHFYLISVVLIIALLNCVYGFAQMIRTGDKRRKNALILQSVSAVTFLGLCILACFTAFWRDGNIEVSALSAVLMSVFFILLGVTVGIFTGSLMLKCRRGIALWIPTVLASATTLLMYIGEMILLHSHLYKFGTGFIFDAIPGIILAPVDILVILCAGAVTYLLMRVCYGKPHR